jgi:phosphonate ABC transporter substrate-binding protein
MGKLRFSASILLLVLPSALFPDVSTAADSPSPRFLVVCSPGSPGTTAQAQPTMDAFALAAGKAAGWPEGKLGAAYFESAEAGLARLSQPDAALALVPPAFLARYGEELGLKPRLEAILESGKQETWSLAAKKGSVSSPGSLKGWEITGAPGFASEFVRAALFKEWGKLPAEARVTFTPRVLSALRRAAGGEAVAVILDSAGAESLPSLPFGADMEIVARSAPIPGALLCTVGSRLGAGEAESLFRGLSRLGESGEGREVLKSLRLSRFAPAASGSSHKSKAPSGDPTAATP